MMNDFDPFLKVTGQNHGKYLPLHSYTSVWAMASLMMNDLDPVTDQKSDGKPFTSLDGNALNMSGWIISII